MTNKNLHKLEQGRYSFLINNSELLSGFDICKFITQKDIINKESCLKK